MLNHSLQKRKTSEWHQREREHLLGISAKSVEKYLSITQTWHHEVGWRIFLFWLNFLIGISLLSKHQAHWISFGQDMLWSIFADSIGVADFTNLVWQNQHNFSPDHQNSTKSLETSKTKLNLGNVHILCQQYFLIFWPPPPSCQHMSATGYPPPLHWHPDYHRWPPPLFLINSLNVKVNIDLNVSI